MGTRITVYWPGDDQWYKGTVAATEPNDEHTVFVEYDDGDSDWVDLSVSKWRRSTKPDKFLVEETNALVRKRERISRLKVGTRISVFWPHEKEYFTGTLTKIKKLQGDSDIQGKPHRIRYDDGDKEWTNLLHRKFKPVDAKALRLRCGSRVSVYDGNKKKYYRATVIEIETTQARPHRVKYDKKSRGEDWVNLNAHPFLDIEPEVKADPDAPPNANTLKKRKREFMTDPPQVETDHGRKVARIKQEQEETIVPQVGAGAAQLDEPCTICKSKAVRPRAASCQHIFCKRCIENRIANRAMLCPACKLPITPDLIKFDPEHSSFRAVEALEMTTAEVVRTFSSASQASLEDTISANLVPSRIIEACRSKRRDERECGGYYWRFKGSKDRILRVDEGVKEGIPIEQVDLNTGEIIEVFSSARKAHEKTGVSRCSIRRVLDRKGKANAGGFFWRFQGETHDPWPDPEPTNLNPVEQLDYKTGDFLQSFDSIADAKRAMGMRPNSGCIREVCEGKGRATAKGFFWRWKGSNVMPNHLMGVQKLVQIRKKNHGKVVKEFRSSREAQAFFGYQCCWSTICRHCREETFYDGYYWSYRMLREEQPEGMEFVGKRLRIHQPGGDDWLEGQLTSYDADSKEYQVVYDCGKIEHRKLDDLSFEWKNDQGQKPVEKLDLKTGKVLLTFNSLSEAAKSVNSLGTSIHAVCAGRCRSAKGFFWRYKGSDAMPPKPKGRRKIEQLCLKTGRVLATFDSIQDAGKAVGITTPGISYCCNGRNGSKSAGGFGWRFAED